MLLIALTMGLLVQAQRESAWWYFGNKGELNFTKTTVESDTFGVLVTLEGCASVSHRLTGERLFYTNGDSIWDSTHIAMPNGHGLLGHSSSSQSAIIVPFTGNKHLYYVFTIDDGALNKGVNGLRYSVIDMRLNGGKGDVDTNRKNIMLMSRAGERLTAVEHHNLTSIWVIAQKYGSNEFYSFEVSSAGIGLPVISKIGPNPMNPRFPTEMHLGCMKVDPLGGMIAFAYTGASSVTITDFDNKTGRLSNERTTYLKKNTLPYGVEFSPNSKYLYVGLFEEVRQFDAFAPAWQFRRSTGIQILKKSGVIYSAIQQAMNKKLYVSTFNHNALAVINAPNIRGGACNIVHSGLPLDTGGCMAGLPSFVQSYFAPTHLKIKNACANEYTVISLKDTSGYDSITYQYGDPSSGLLNFSSNRLDSHIYRIPGSYTVTAIGYFYYKGQMIIDTLIQTIKVDDIPRFKLPNDTVICRKALKINLPKNKEYTYKWYNGSTIDSTLNKTSGKIWAEITNVCGTVSDTMILQIDQPAQVSLGPDTIICKGENLKLIVNKSKHKIQWSSGSKDSSILVNNTGVYWVKVSNTCSSASDSISVKTIDEPVVDLPDEIHSCKSNPKAIVGRYKFVDHYLWSNGDTNDRISVTNPGWYKCEVSNQCKTNADSVYVRIDYPQAFTLGQDTFLCHPDKIELRPRIIQPLDSFLWSPIQIFDTVLDVSTSGVYRLTTYNACGEYWAEVKIDQLFKPQVNLGKDTILCEGEQATFTRHKPKVDNYNQYNWSGIEQGGELTISKAGKYWMEQKNPCGVSSDTIEISIVNTPYFGLRDTFKCENENLVFDYSEYNQLSFTWNMFETEYVHTVYDYSDQLLWVKNDLGCLGTERFGIDRCPNPLYIPNAFSPNFDGLNEKFIVFKSDISFYEIEILDRWNKVVYRSNNIEDGWNGTVFNNDENVCPAGQYIWKIRFQEYQYDYVQTELGEVQLIR